MQRVFSVPRRALSKQVLLDLFPRAEAAEVEDCEVLRRQVGGSLTPRLVTRKKCKHGYSQAIVSRAVSLETRLVNSGMVRLTCPHLVKLIDDIERDGGVKKYNERIRNQEDVLSNFENVNEAWRIIKQKIISEEERQCVKDRLGIQSNAFFDSGIIGIMNSKNRDVKCLHAHVADEFIRNDNYIGKMVLEDIKEAGDDPTGCNECWQQCNSSIPQDKTTWWYESVKNKSKLRRKRRNRELGIDGDNHLS